MTSIPDDKPQASSDLDPIGPHGHDTPAPGGAVSGGGTEETPPLNTGEDAFDVGRGNNARTGGTTHAQGGDSGRLGPPSEQLSSSNGPSDPAAKRETER